MGLHRLHPGDIQVGAPLPSDAYDSAGRLLLRRGAIIQTSEQLERLLDIGLFSDVGSARSAEPGAQKMVVAKVTRQAERERVSVFAVLDGVRSRLAEIIPAPPNAQGFALHIAELAHRIQRACEIDPDAALAGILLSRSLPYSIRQSCNAAVVCEILFRQLEWPPEQRLPGIAAALTMNISMLKLQDELYHQRHSLEPAQKEAILAHPHASAAMLAELGVEDTTWRDAVAQHHEALDGSGYPERLPADAIGMPARVLAIADKYCATVSERAYRSGLSPDAALREVLIAHGGDFDTTIAARLVRALGIYPPGSAVELDNGEIGVVVKRTLDARHPVVRAVRSTQGRWLPDFPKRLTSKPPFGVKCAVDRARLDPTFDPATLWHPAMVERDS
jgi:HD-GYP domain-containing protein (c-di-GMP phosphodiesterase class II)